MKGVQEGDKEKKRNNNVDTRGINMQTGKEQDERESWSKQESKSQETSEWIKKKREEKGGRQKKQG